MQPHFVWDINFGNIVTLAGFLFALYSFNSANQTRSLKMHEDNIRVLTAINTKLDIMWSWFDKNQIGHK